MAGGPGLGFVYGLVGGALMAGALLTVGFAGVFVVLLFVSALPFIKTKMSMLKELSIAAKTPSFWLLYLVALAIGFFGALAAVVG